MEHCFLTRKTKDGIVIKGLSAKPHNCSSYRFLPDNTVEIIIPHMINGIPVVAIANNAFKHNFDVSVVTVGRHVKCIGKSSFIGCTSLRSVKLHDGVEVIDDSAFKGCISLEEVKTPKSLREIKHNAFALCKKLRFISVNAAQDVENTAFTACDELKHIYGTQDIGEFMSDKKPHMFRIGASTFRSTDGKDGYICFDIGERDITAVPRVIGGKPVYYEALINS